MTEPATEGSAVKWDAESSTEDGYIEVAIEGAGVRCIVEPGCCIEPAIEIVDEACRLDCEGEIKLAAEEAGEACTLDGGSNKEPAAEGAGVPGAREGVAATSEEAGVPMAGVPGATVEIPLMEGSRVPMVPATEGGCRRPRTDIAGVGAADTPV